MQRVGLAILRGAVLTGAVLAAGCGASEPRESDIFHDPALRPSVVAAANDAERALLARLNEDDIEGPVVIDGHSYAIDAPYAAASGRRCRVLVDEGDRRLACETDEGSWVFVPPIVRAP